jgi:hypothetical protein
MTGPISTHGSFPMIRALRSESDMGSQKGIRGKGLPNSLLRSATRSRPCAQKSVAIANGCAHQATPSRLVVIQGPRDLKPKFAVFRLCAVLPYDEISLPLCQWWNEYRRDSPLLRRCASWHQTEKAYCFGWSLVLAVLLPGASEGVEGGA